MNYDVEYVILVEVIYEFFHVIALYMRWVKINLLSIIYLCWISIWVNSYLNSNWSIFLFIFRINNQFIDIKVNGNKTKKRSQKSVFILRLRKFVANKQNMLTFFAAMKFFLEKCYVTKVWSFFTVIHHVVLFALSKIHESVYQWEIVLSCLILKLI